MAEKYLFYFGLTALTGLVIMIAGLKLTPRPKRIFETLGAVVFHVGVFGVLYFKVSITLFVSLVALVLSLFILIDPLKLALLINQKFYRRVGWILCAVAAAFLVMYFTNFPVWLWLIPMVVALLPYIVPPFKKYDGLLTVMSWVCVFVYTGLISYAVYSRFYPENAHQELTSWFTQNQSNGIMSTLDTDQQRLLEKTRQQEGVRDVPVIQSGAADEPTLDTHRKDFRLFSQDGPFLKSLREADNKFLKLKEEFKKMKKHMMELEEENTELKSRLPDSTTSVQE